MTVRVRLPRSTRRAIEGSVKRLPGLGARGGSPKMGPSGQIGRGGSMRPWPPSSRGAGDGDGIQRVRSTKNVRSRGMTPTNPEPPAGIG